MKYYLIGIKGAGLSALAIILKQLGNEVVGYDDEKKHQFTEDRLTSLGIEIYSDDAYELTTDYVVIRSTAINEAHPEILKAKKLKLKIYEYNEFLGELTKEFKTIAISGCHGKTTTTSMLKTVIDPAIGCNYLVGDGTGHADPKNELFIIEACEYRRNFLAYHPSITVITNVDLDHVDYFSDLDDIKSAYSEFTKNTKDLLVICGDDPNARSLKVTKPVLYYGLNKNNDVVAQNVRYDESGVSFEVYFQGEVIGEFVLPFFGEHQVLNALAVITVAHTLEIPVADINQHLATFKGANRRFQEKKIGNNIIIDDYAHHPKEIEVVIGAVKQKYPNHQLVAIFEPHTFSRTIMFAKEIAQALNAADETYVLDIFKSRENPADYRGVNSNIIIKHLTNGRYLERDVKVLTKYDDAVFLFMSPKDVSDLIDNLTKELSK